MMRSYWKTAVYHALVVAIGCFMVYPILWNIMSSLKPEDEIFRNAASLIPSRIMWSNYAQGWKGFGDYHFGIFFRNSFLVTVLVVIGTLFSSTLVSFGFGRLQFPLKRFLFACLLVTIMLPMQVTMIPQYILFHQLGWINTFLPLVVPAYIGGVPFFIFLMVQFVRGVPRELDEAAYIDGASTFGIFTKVLLPLMRPALATVSIFSFYWTWDDFMGPLIYLTDPGKFTVARGLQMFADPSSITAWGPLLAMSTLSLVPVFFIFLFFQKYLVEGIATTGLKG